jgi:tetratricopeptide (TPR) repeat protein
MNRALLVVIILVAIAFSFKNLKEPDIFWQLRTGNWILENNSIPHTDPLSFTYESNTWTNIKWGYEVLLALYEPIAGAAAIPLLQALVSVLLLLLLYKHSLKLLVHYQKTHLQFLLYPLLLFGLTMLEFRMTSRPEMFSQLFMVLYVFILTTHTISRNKLIYIIPVIQLLWANLHEGYGIGWAVLLIWQTALWMHYYFHGDTKPVRETIVALISFAGVIVNPYGVELLWRPLSLLNQLQETKYTTEFVDYTYFQYWQKESYVALMYAVLVLLFICLTIIKRNTKKQTKLVARLTADPVMLFNAILVLAFTYLALNALRNVVFLQLISIPLLLAYFPFNSSQKILRIEPYTKFATLLAGIALYVTVVSNKYYTWIGSTQRYGLEISSLNNPEGAASYLAKHGLQGEVFSDYMVSSYFLWRLQPNYRSYIDLREHEVFPPEFFTEFSASVFYPEVFATIDSQHHFTAYALYTPQFAPLHRYFYTSSQFRLAYVDAVAAVYIKDTVQQNAAYTYAQSIPSGVFAYVLSKLFYPFYLPIRYDTTSESYGAASYFISVGDVEKANTYIEQGLSSTQQTDILLVYKAKLHELLSQRDTGIKNIQLDSAMLCYQQAIRINERNAAACFGLANIYMSRERMKDAIRLFENTVKLDPANKDAYVQMGEAYKYLANLNGKKEDLLKAIAAYEKAYRLDKKNLYISASLGLLHYSNGNCERAVELLLPAKDYGRIGVSERNLIKQCLINCGERI